MLGDFENYALSRIPSDSELAGLSVLDLVSRDLNTFLDHGNDRQKRLIFLSRKIGIHKKTLHRISAKENNPSGPTIMKLYRFLYNVDQDSQVLKLVPETLRNYLKRYFPEKTSEGVVYNENALKMLLANPVALEIYLLAVIKNVTKAELKARYGDYGVNILQDLIKEKLLDEVSPEIYSEGQRKLSYTPELVIQAGKICIEAFGKPESGYEADKHFAFFFYEKLNEEAYREWMKIDQRAMKEKIELSQKIESKGTIPAFCFSIVETLHK